MPSPAMTDVRKKLRDLRKAGRITFNPAKATDVQAEMLIQIFDVKDHLERQDVTNGQILDQTTLHNGRLQTIEDWKAELEKQEKEKEQADAISDGIRAWFKKPFKIGWKIAGVGVAVVLAASSIQEFFAFVLGMLQSLIHHF